MNSVPTEIEGFLLEHIHSVDELEILLLLRSYRQTSWTGDAVARELRLDPKTSAERLVDLQRRGFVNKGPNDGFVYAPRGAGFDHALSILAQAYPKFRNAIIRLIFSKPNEKVQSFAEALSPRRDANK